MKRQSESCLSSRTESKKLASFGISLLLNLNLCIQVQLELTLASLTVSATPLVSHQFALINSTPCPDLQCDNGDCVVTNGTLKTKRCECYNGWTGALCQFCDGRFRLTEAEGTIHDGAGNYSLNTSCSWLIDTNYSKPLKLSFHYFSTECGWDHLHIFDGSSIYSPLVGSFSGISDIVEDVLLLSGKGFLYFYSDVAYSMGGFNLTYRTVVCPLDCSGNGKCDLESERCVCEVDWSGEACNISASCPNQCSGKTFCVNGTCQCPPHLTGDGCSLPADPSNMSWLTVDSASPAPVGRASFGADVLGNYFYIYGGETLLNRYTTHSNTEAGFYRYDISAGTWTGLSANFSMLDRFGHTLSGDSAGQKLYLYGGTVNGLPTDDLFSYDIVSDSWQFQHSGLVSVTGHTAHVVDNKFYIFFGKSSLYGFYQGIQLYDILSSNWSYVETSGVVVSGRYGHSSVYDDHTDSVLVFGGYHNGVKAGTTDAISKFIYRFNVNSSTWVALTPAHHPSYLHASVVLPEGLMLVSGGNSHNDTNKSSGSKCYSARLLAYDLCCEMWIDLKVDDLTESRINRFGHKMFTHNGSTYVYGGFNGRMLPDVIRLHTPKCSLFNNKLSCEKALYQRTAAYSTCEWNDTQGCIVRDGRNAVCNKDVCLPSTPAVTNLTCNQFADCVSCSSTDACYFEPGTADGGGHCAVENASSRSNNAYCPSSSICSKYRDCELCKSIDHCFWSSANSSCLVKSQISKSLREKGQQCPVPCHRYDSCSNCTASDRCLWCESQSQCVDSNAYLAYFPYGQCLEWRTKRTGCSGVACSEINSCGDCHRNPMCGWCNDPSNTGKGSCMRGGLAEDLTSTCRADASTWHFASCPACQCNGHSLCNATGKCVNCLGHTTGDHCEVCAAGFYGDPTNGGICQRCDCDAVADYCDDRTGACRCRVQGATGDRCTQCDNLRQYYMDTLMNKECYYKVGVEYRYTFNFSKPDDGYVTVINMQCRPRYSDREMELTLTCESPARINLTSYSASYTTWYRSIYSSLPCSAEGVTLKIDPKDYHLDSVYNSTIYLTLSQFRTPFVFQVSFSQYPRVDLFKFFLIFFGCFLFLLIVAGVVWKVKAQYAMVRRRSQERQERRNMASRPFASLILFLDDLKDISCSERALNGVRAATKPSGPAGGGESHSTIHRTFSKRNKSKQHHVTNMAVGLEPLEGQKSAAVATVLIKLPTGGEEVPGYGCSGLALGSTLVSVSSNGISHYNMSSKVSYRHGKVTFTRSPLGLFNS